MFMFVDYQPTKMCSRSFSDLSDDLKRMDSNFGGQLEYETFRNGKFTQTFLIKLCYVGNLPYIVAHR